MMNNELVYIGQVISLDEIPNSDFLFLATVVCGKGGRWKGVVSKCDFSVGSKCIVYLPDSVIPENPSMAFMAKTKWRVKMMRFRGVPSEVVIMPYIGIFKIGDDVTEFFKVTKYVKELPSSLAGIAKCGFPRFIPKTDEPDYQRVPDLVEELKGKRYYISEKLDGSSTTAYKHKGIFGVCSRNLELEDGDNAYWKVARKYNLQSTIPEGYAVQWETCGPKIQKNPLGLPEVDGFAFSVYDIPAMGYLEGNKFIQFCHRIGFPTARILSMNENFQECDLTQLSSGNYESGHVREGIVIRSWENVDGRMISFKVINLDYET